MSPSRPYEPEPTLDEENYQAILGIISSMTLVMERSPHAFSMMGEEDLRQHYLVQLNGHFEGRATGETFNFLGKSDILIRERDRNLFIAECKFWRGEKSFIATVDQLLGYMSWRDTKAAILIFNRNQDFTEVVRVAEASFQSHSQFKRGYQRESETRFRGVLGNPEDKSREVIVTVMAFNIPRRG